MAKLSKLILNTAITSVANLVKQIQAPNQINTEGLNQLMFALAILEDVRDNKKYIYIQNNIKPEQVL